MELVYLWVKKYKNIKEQGFNFSPKFNCHYDEDSNELTIDENDDYIENFFGDKINVTAIVGKNGSGKSSVFELITTFSFEEYLDKKTFLVFFNDNTFSFKQSNTGKKLDFRIINNTRYSYEKVNKSRTIDSLYFGNELSTIFNNLNMKGIKEYHGDIDAFKDAKFDLDNQKYASKEKVIKFETFNKRFQFILQKNSDILKDIDDILVFDKYRKELHFYEMIFSIASNENIKELIGKDNLGSNTIFKALGFNLSNNDDEILLYKLLIIFRLNKYEISIGQEEKLKKLISEIESNFKEDFTKEKFWNINKIIDEYDRQEDIYTKSNVEEILTTYTYNDNEIWIQKSLTPITVDFETKNKLIHVLDGYGVIRIEFINSLDDSYNYFMLSSGERNYIEIFVTYIYHLIIFENQKENHNRKFLFLFDEIDLGLHPNWQKRLIENLLSFANKYFSYPIQLILTTHSPFLLSDIPKQNIVFLDKDENGKCKVVDGLEEKKQTFGANIHTLLSDSFFMEDGLMGEFAKGKINKIIAFHKKVEKEDASIDELTSEYKAIKDNLWQTQSIVGDDYLKQVLKNHLIEIEKILLGKDIAKENEIKRTEVYLESLRND